MHEAEGSLFLPEGAVVLKGIRVDYLSAVFLPVQHSDLLHFKSTAFVITHLEI